MAWQIAQRKYSNSFGSRILNHFSKSIQLFFFQSAKRKYSIIFLSNCQEKVFNYFSFKVPSEKKKESI